ncbi:uncharacterized protein LOC117930594 [Vitis riparia]|uniref:uncharacterized protein LOC117910211 n=1 Tax=Vitis riparia TaxID=96939 RepID=UPI00155AD53B|nr:uncharacterized protein LOC117910211 [Vitis riparia]XP_034707119.1 uncharacterized protein LOC117930594 [Vitis riparia]
MARPSYHRLFNQRILKLVMVLVGFCLACCILGPPLYWHFKGSSRAQTSCGSCDCGCDSDTTFSITLDCGDHDPDMKEEMKKGRLALLAEELRLQKNVTDDRLERTKELTTEVRKASSQYRKEVEKCSIGIETCEEAREKAEAALVDELKLSALWEERARELGWSHGI